jgi:hypothetical protein
MKILVTGSTGMVGSALVPFLAAGGHDVVRLVRGDAPPGAPAARWDPAAGRIDSGGLEGLDAVVHLAGENIAAGRWTAARKARIRDSRVNGTRLLAGALARLQRRPRVLVCASAVGFYGDRGDEVLRETSHPGTGFLPEVCREWEAAAEPAARAGVRVVNARIGFVLSPSGGGLKKMLPPFRLGLGGPIGDGRQYVSWVSIEDVTGVILHAVRSQALVGPVNTVAPNPVTNREFTRTLARILSRPAIFPMPAFAARLAFGELADAILLSSQRVEPARLKASGYEFRHPHLDDALRALLGRPARPPAR